MEADHEKILTYEKEKEKACGFTDDAVPVASTPPVEPKRIDYSLHQRPGSRSNLADSNKFFPPPVPQKHNDWHNRRPERANFGPGFEPYNDRSRNQEPMFHNRGRGNVNPYSRDHPYHRSEPYEENNPYSLRSVENVSQWLPSPWERPQSHSEDRVTDRTHCRPNGVDGSGFDSRVQSSGPSSNENFFAPPVIDWASLSKNNVTDEIRYKNGHGNSSYGYFTRKHSSDSNNESSGAGYSSSGDPKANNHIISGSTDTSNISAVTGTANANIASGTNDSPQTFVANTTGSFFRIPEDSGSSNISLENSTGLPSVSSDGDRYQENNHRSGTASDPSEEYVPECIGCESSPVLQDYVPGKILANQISASSSTSSLRAGDSQPSCNSATKTGIDSASQDFNDTSIENNSLFNTSDRGKRSPAFKYPSNTVDYSLSSSYGSSVVREISTVTDNVDRPTYGYWTGVTRSASPALSDSSSSSNSTCFWSEDSDDSSQTSFSKRSIGRKCYTKKLKLTIDTNNFGRPASTASVMSEDFSESRNMHLPLVHLKERVAPAAALDACVVPEEEQRVKEETSSRPASPSVTALASQKRFTDAEQRIRSATEAFIDASYQTYVKPDPDQQSLSNDS